MGNVSTDVNVSYSTALTNALIAKIDEDLTTMTEAHKAAMESYDTIKTAFTGSSSDIIGEFENIATTENGEVQKAADNLANIVSGLKNIDTSWVDVADAVLNSLKKYQGKNG